MNRCLRWEDCVKEARERAQQWSGRLELKVPETDGRIFERMGCV